MSKFFHIGDCELWGGDNSPLIECKFKKGQRIKHRDGQICIIEMTPNSGLSIQSETMMTLAYMYSLSGINYVAPQDEMEDGRFEAVS